MCVSTPSTSNHRDEPAMNGHGQKSDADVSSSKPQLHEIAREVVEHYGDGFSCAIVTYDEGIPVVNAQWGSVCVSLPSAMNVNENSFTLFHHHTGRILPIIVDGYHNKLERDPLAKSMDLHFYAAAPLVPPGESCSACKGVIAIVSRKPVDTFCLSDSAFLSQKADEAARNVGATGVTK
eukprot:TRINITY_DN56878_c0_g1_i1.p1 TRINITY_DN56878_c0_g1~~TRINITY_DN56878_c0_g1_i1.p1  ORF type:complete len:179 (+),score=19.40 TRINITY_DN56878_c0_g1_i1:52-588(+)